MSIRRNELRWLPCHCTDVVKEPKLILILKRGPVSVKLVYETPKRPEVGLRAEDAPIDQLRAQIFRRAHKARFAAIAVLRPVLLVERGPPRSAVLELELSELRADGGSRGIEHQDRREIDQLQMLVLSEEDVFGLDVPVDQAVLVNVLQDE